MSGPWLRLGVHALTGRVPAERPAVTAVPSAEALQAALDIGERAQTVAELSGERLGLGEALLLEHREAVLAQAPLRKGRQLVGERTRGVEGAPRRHDPLDQPDPLGLLGADRAAG